MACEVKRGKPRVEQVDSHAELLWVLDDDEMASVSASMFKGV